MKKTSELGQVDSLVAFQCKRSLSGAGAEFLKEIEGWREVLAQSIALRNQDVSLEVLINAVQRILVWLVFLRMAEDCGIEPSEQLLKLTEHPEIYPRFLRDLCRKAGEKYNSGLFHFQEESGLAGVSDRIAPRLTVDDEIITPLIRSLYVAHGSLSPCGILPIEILGTVYERLLGRVIRLTPGHQAKREDKPEVRKAGGIYYTPSYIVDYIIKETVGKKIEGKSPAQLAGGNDQTTFRVMDMACGSGAFLLGAYQFLLEYCLKWYSEHEPETQGNTVCQDTQTGSWRLTMKEKKRLLTTHIFGVDIDWQAVEVAKLSLLLKMLGGEGSLALSNQLGGPKTGGLPNLGENIKCGNSLLGPEFFSGQRLSDSPEIGRINPFDWDHEFPIPIREGGFHCVIGNPPWGQKHIAKEDKLFRYLKRKYPSTEKGIFDMFRPFTEAAIQRTLKGGNWGFVLPDIILLKEYPLTRSFILDNIAITGIAFWGMAFPDAAIDATTIVGKKESNNTYRMDSIIQITIKDKEGNMECKSAKQIDFTSCNEFKFNLFMDERTKRLIEKLKKWPQFSEFCETHEGVHSGNIRNKLFVKKKENEQCAPLILGRSEVQKYRLKWLGQYVNLDPKIIKRESGDYANVGKPQWFTSPKLIIRRTGDHLVCALDLEGFYFSNNVFVAPPLAKCEPDLHYILGLLNSKLMTWFYLAIQPRKGRVFSEVKIKHIKTFPIRPIVFGSGNEKAIYERIINLVQSMMLLQTQFTEATSVSQKEILQRQIDATDAEINRIVYQLYDLTPEEITFVEGQSL